MTTTQAAPPAISLNGKFTLLMATGLALLATPMVSPAMPDIAVAFAEQARTEPFARWLVGMLGMSADSPNVKFLVKFILLSVPALFIVAGAPVVGWIIDKWGRRPLLMASLVLFAVAGTSGVFATTFLEMFIGRALLGLSVAGIKTCTVTMVGDYFVGKERAMFIGWQGSAMKVGGVIFLLFGGILADIHWRIPFWGYLLSGIAIPGLIFSLYESMPKKLAAAAEKVKARAQVPYGPVSYIFFAAFMASVLFFITLVQLPFFLDDSFAASPTQKGAAVALANLFGAVVATFYYRFKGRMSFVSIWAFVFLMIGIGYGVVTVSANYVTVLLAMMICGVGFGLIVPNQSAWMLSIMPPESRGLGIGIVTTAMFLGQAAASVVIEPFIDPNDPSHVFQVASGVLFALAAIYGAVAWLGRGRAVGQGAD